MTITLSKDEAERIAQLHQAVVILVNATVAMHDGDDTYEARTAAWDILDNARRALALDLAMAVNPIAIKFPQYWTRLSQQEEVA